VQAGIEAANAYLQRRFAASVTGDTIQPTTEAGEELHALNLGFDTEYDSHLIGQGLEKVVNKLYGETGSYYTPEEMVAFMVERTVHLKILDEIGASDADTVDEWLQTASDAAIANALESIRDLSVCDPACGSGHFLIGALDELVRIQLACHHRLGNDVQDWRIAKRTAERNIYGVDLVGEAVAMSKLRVRLYVLRRLPEHLAAQYATPDTREVVVA
jgi:type I restriction-modification system DNA methylase subunit